MRTEKTRCGDSIERSGLTFHEGCGDFSPGGPAKFHDTRKLAPGGSSASSRFLPPGAVTNSECFIYASLTVDRLPLPAMSLDDQPRVRRRQTGHTRCARQLETFAVLAWTISLALAFVSSPAGSASRGRATHAVHSGSGADSRQPHLNDISQNQAAWNVRYTVRLKLETGDEQSITVIAPPGGLQLVMRDMTGDHVPNDVLVTPALLHWPLTVLVNDGHQFTVAIFGTFPDSASDPGRASSGPGIRETAALPAGKFETHPASLRRGLVPPAPCEAFFSPGVTTVTASRTFGSGPGRAPPSFVTNI
jgi:hypothetical protein